MKIRKYHFKEIVIRENIKNKDVMQLSCTENSLFLIFIVFSRKTDIYLGNSSVIANLLKLQKSRNIPLDMKV